MPPVPTVTSITLSWLLRLRWVAVAGQFASLGVAAFGLDLDMPWIPLLVVLALTGGSNLFLQHQTSPDSPDSEWKMAAVIAMDVVLLSVMLFCTGGASNPFTSFYLVLVALAAMALSLRWLAIIVALCTAGYLLVWKFGLPLNGPDGIGEIGCPGYGLHLQGMAAAFFLTALCIAFFVQKMNRSLRGRDAALAEAETKAARADQFSALASLAAGVAHELGTPLGTIALASRELERTLEQQCGSGETLEDARLIRQEVERCRRILDRLDQRSTSGTGDAPAPLTAAELVSALKSALPDAMLQRLSFRDETDGAIMHVPQQPVVQSLLILIQNACEADTAGSPVDLIVSHGADGLCMRVLDRGPGLSPAARKHAGEPFFTTKPPRQGMGLGLFLVRTLALQLGGSLSHEPRTGGGTTAILLLPA